MRVTLEQALALVGGELDQPTVDTYVAHRWVRPIASEDGLWFEEIDLARIRLVRHLQRDMDVNDHGMDVVLNLLDQLYELRRRMETVTEPTVSTAEFWEEQEEF